MREITIIGAGITGNTLAIALKKKGYKVTVYEQGISPDHILQGQGKSINLAMSCRSKDALNSYGISYPVTVPMRSRLFYTEEGVIKSPYDQFGSALESINRNDLNAALYQQARDLGVMYYFEKRLMSIDFSHKTCTFQNEAEPVRYDYLIGADGSKSEVAKAIDKSFGDSYEPVKVSPWCYQEYTIQANDNRFQLEDPEQFHVWAGNNIFLIALPNDDKTFTVTLFCHKDSGIDLRKIKNDNNLEEIKTLFKQLVPVAEQLSLFDIDSNFTQNSVSSIYSRESKYWHENSAQPRVLLMGDAACAFPPFLGLGMNKAIEDVMLFINIMSDNISETILTFSKKREKDVLSLAAASVENAEVLSARDPDQFLKFSITDLFERKYPGVFIEPHTMYSFTHMPLDLARQRQRYQNDMLRRLVEIPGFKDAFAITHDLESVLNRDEKIKASFYAETDKGMKGYEQLIANWWKANRNNILLSPFYSPAPKTKSTNSLLLRNCMWSNEGVATSTTSEIQYSNTQRP